MQRIALIVGILAGMITIISYIADSHQSIAQNNFTGITGDSNRNNIIVQNAKDVTINSTSNNNEKCDKVERYIVKSNQYGAVNKRIFRIMTKAFNNKNLNKIRKLESDGLIHRFNGGEIVCVEQIDFYNYLRKIYVPSQASSYWVSDGAIKINE